MTAPLTSTGLSLALESTIRGIHAYRRRTGYSLKEARDAVETALAEARRERQGKCQVHVPGPVHVDRRVARFTRLSSVCSLCGVSLSLTAAHVSWKVE